MFAGCVQQEALFQALSYNLMSIDALFQVGAEHQAHAANLGDAFNLSKLLGEVVAHFGYAVVVMAALRALREQQP